MAPNSDKLTDWYRALFAENCVKVRELLKMDETLLNKGWTADTQGSSQFHGWKGRTALHVAARRGDVDLMEWTLNLYSKMLSKGQSNGAGGSTSSHLLEVVDGDYDLDALAMAVVNGNRDIVKLLTTFSRPDTGSTTPDVRSHMAKDGSSSPRPAPSEHRDKGEDNEAAKAQKTAEEVQKVAYSNHDFERLANPGTVDLWTKSRRPDSGSTLSDANHDAEVGSTPHQPAEENQGNQGNQANRANRAIQAALLKKFTKEALEENAKSFAAMDKLQTNSGSTPSHISQEAAHESTDGENDATAVADQVLGKLQLMYQQDCDFNFLDINLYFFHFSFSTWKSQVLPGGLIERIRNAIFSRARVHSLDTMKYLLFELLDGQGRTPLHVAVDSQKVDEFLHIIPGQRKDSGLEDKELDYYYLNKHDSAGRTPLYRAAAKNYYFAVQHLLKDKRTNLLAKAECSAYQWGEGVDIDKLSWRNNFESDCVYIPKSKLLRKAFNNESNSQGGPGPNIEILENISSTALHVAIIQKHTSIVKLLLDTELNEESSPRSQWEPRAVNPEGSHVRADAAKDNAAEDGPVKHTAAEDGATRLQFQSRVACCRRFTWPVVADLEGDGGQFKVESKATPLQLAVLVGSVPILQRLLQEEDERDKPQSELKTSISSFHLAAARGTPAIIKAFLDSSQGSFNPLSKDGNGNTALHHALKGKNVELHPHLVDFVGCHHVFKWRWENSDWISEWLANPKESSPYKKSVKGSQDEQSPNSTSMERTLEVTAGSKRVGESEKYGKRMGSINLLLQAGISIWEKNGQDRTANPEPDASDDFVQWWYETVAKQTQQVQENFNAAANAISVTAALVATASYVGPFTPPLGYGDASSAQVTILAVRIFVVCDNLSFYLALAAIMLSLLPSLPLPHDSMFRELVRTRMLVARAVACLFPSIICILLAFAAGYVAVIPDHGLAYHGLTVATMVVGGFICLLVMIEFVDRLVKVLKTLLTDIKKEMRSLLAGFKKNMTSVHPGQLLHSRHFKRDFKK